jgi:hypothetical protein
MPTELPSTGIQVHFTHDYSGVELLNVTPDQRAIAHTVAQILDCSFDSALDALRRSETHQTADNDSDFLEKCFDRAFDLLFDAVHTFIDFHQTASQTDFSTLLTDLERVSGGTATLKISRDVDRSLRGQEIKTITLSLPALKLYQETDVYVYEVKSFEIYLWLAKKVDNPSDKEIPK